MRRGISYSSIVDHLAAHPEVATFRLVEVGEKRIRLAYTLKDPVRINAGNGIEDSWLGFFSMSVREGILTLDARRLTPLEHRAEGVVETFSQYVEVGRGTFAPLAIRVDQRGMSFDWTFQVFEPGLWLFASSRYDRSGGPKGLMAELDQVKVDRVAGKLKALGERQPK